MTVTRLNWKTARFLGRCTTCASDIIRGDTVAFANGRLLCRACGRKMEAKQIHDIEQRRQAAERAKRDKPDDTD